MGGSVARSSDTTRLAACGGVSLAIYVVGFTLPYPIARGLTRPLDHFGHMTGPSVGPTIAFVAALTGLFLLYTTALRICSRCEGRAQALAVAGGGAIVLGLALLPMYPAFSLDIFYYMSADRIWSLYRENPFVVPPLQGAHDPFFPYTAWGHYPLPYGPLWPWITQATSRFGGGDVAQTLLAFKGLAVVGYLLCTAAITWAVGAVRPDRRLTATCIFAWNPLVLLELAGNGHNDAVCLVPAIVALGLWARRRSVPATVALAVSFLTKATVVVIGPALLVASLRRAVESRTIGRWLWTHLIVAAALYLVAWMPFRSSTAAGFWREADQYYQSVTALAMALMAAGLSADMRPVGLRVVQVALVGGFVAFYFFQLRALGHEGREGLRAMWRITVVYFLVVMPFFSPWYIVWPTAIAALLAERRTTQLTTLLCIGSLSTYLVQFVLRPVVGPGWPMWPFSALALALVVTPFLFGLVLTRGVENELEDRPPTDDSNAGDPHAAMREVVGASS